MSNLRLNLSASTYSVAVYFVGQMALTPVLLWFWGKEVYAHWLVLFTIPAYFGFSDAGIANFSGRLKWHSLPTTWAAYSRHIAFKHPPIGKPLGE